MTDRTFDVLHDDGRSICLVGRSYVNQMVYDCLKPRRNIVLLTAEEARQQSVDFFQDYQFFSTASDIHFKKTTVDWLMSKKVSFISLVDRSSVIDPDVTIGCNTVILDHNSFTKGITIGDHCHVVNYTTIAHETVISDFCYICGYSYICFTQLGMGSVVGLRSSFVPKPPLKLHIPAWTNFLLNSAVNRPIAEPGTYYGNRKISNETTLTYRIM